MSFIELIFDIIFTYYFLSLIPLTLLGLVLGFYQLLKFKQYNFKFSIVWLIVSFAILIIARLYSLVYIPDFGCDECIDTISDYDFIRGILFGLFGSLAIYSFPLYRLFKVVINYIRLKYKMIKKY